MAKFFLIKVYCVGADRLDDKLILVSQDESVICSRVEMVGAMLSRECPSYKIANISKGTITVEALDDDKPCKFIEAACISEYSTGNHYKHVKLKAEDVAAFRAMYARYKIEKRS